MNYFAKYEDSEKIDALAGDDWLQKSKRADLDKLYPDTRRPVIVAYCLGVGSAGDLTPISRRAFGGSWIDFNGCPVRR